MPLVKAQIEAVEATILHLIDDLPKNKAELLKLSEIFYQAFTKKLPADHEYYSLQQCIDNPPNFFQRLEKFRPILIGEVQFCILELVTSKLKRNCEELNIPFAEIEWKFEELKNLLITHALYEKEFVSIPARFDVGDHPQDSLRFPGRIFSAQLVPIHQVLNDTFIFIGLDLYIKIVDEDLFIDQELKIPFADPPEMKEAVFDDDSEDEFIRSLMPEAIKRTNKEAQHVISEFLVENQFFKKEEMDGLNNEAKNLLTYSFYLRLAAQKELDFKQLSSVNFHNYQTLTDPSTIQLLKNNVGRFEVVKELSQHARRVVNNPIYNDMLCKREIRLSDVQGVRYLQSKRLVLPNVVNLVQAKLLSFKQAKGLTPFAAMIILDTYLYDQMMQHKLNPLLFNRFLKEDYDRFMVLWKAKILQQQHFTLLNHTLLHIILHRNIYGLIMKNKITLDQTILLPRHVLLRMMANERNVTGLNKAELIKQISEWKEVSPPSPRFFIKPTLPSPEMKKDEPDIIIQEEQKSMSCSSTPRANQRLN